MYGVGQGLNEGVRMAGSFLSDAMKMKQQQNRFDQSMERDYDRMALEKAWVDARQKIFHDRLAIEQGWNDGRAGRPSMFDAQDEQAALPPDAFPRTPASPAVPQAGHAPAPQPLSGPAVSTPHVTIRPMQLTPAQHLLPAPKIVAKPARAFMPSPLSASRSRWPR
ncbi:MAG: hypothetical protein U0223_12820 [Nitrospira sp.]|nr:hypothetical protein [Nitrospira sp.]